MKTDGGETIWRMTLSYDGTDFHGWQIQPGRPTVQGIVADALARVTGEQSLPQGSGRTDAGVHAEGQVVSFGLRAPIPEENLRRALNRILPSSIRVLAAKRARPDFHARHSALAKSYEYRIFAGEICPTELARYVACCTKPMNFAAMQQASAMVLGQHDFTSFAATDPDRAARLAGMRAPAAEGLQERAGDGQATDPQGKVGNIRRIEHSQWSRTVLPASALFSSAASEGELWTYTVRGNGFLHHMVRNLVGTFLEVGLGRMAPSAIQSILDGRNRSLAGPTAPAKGLWLKHVVYPTDGPDATRA